MSNKVPVHPSSLFRWVDDDGVREGMIERDALQTPIVLYTVDESTGQAVDIFDVIFTNGTLRFYHDKTWKNPDGLSLSKIWKFDSIDKRFRILIHDGYTIDCDGKEIEKQMDSVFESEIQL
jgi:hypothetical protein